MTLHFFWTYLETQKGPNYWYAQSFFVWWLLRQRHGGWNSGLKPANIVNRCFATWTNDHNTGEGCPLNRYLSFNNGALFNIVILLLQYWRTPFPSARCTCPIDFKIFILWRQITFYVLCDFCVIKHTLWLWNRPKKCLWCFHFHEKFYCSATPVRTPGV